MSPARKPESGIGRSRILRALPEKTNRLGASEDHRGVRQVRRADVVAKQSSDHQAAGLLAQLSWNQAYADVPSRLFAAQPGGQKTRLGGYPEGDQRAAR